MQVDYVLILAAGQGTRMGEIGKKIPKVIWPVFQKSILELEVLYCKKFANKNVFINLYHYKEKIKTHIKDRKTFEDVSILEEEDILDIGGAIHNLAKKVDYQGKLLVVNSDQFIMLNNKQWEDFYQLSEKNDSALLTYSVQASDLYNATIYENNRLVEIKKNNLIDRSQIHETYTGMSIINLEKITPTAGRSKFFDSVADYKNLKIGVMNIDESTYWDFGTIKRYYFSMFAILEKWNQKDPFIEFLKLNNALDEKLILKNSYKADCGEVINLCNQHSFVGRTIYLSESSIGIPDENCIVHGDLIDFVNHD